MVEIKQNLVSSSKYSIKCPYSLKPEYITIHNTGNDASAKNEVAYMIRNDNNTGFHFAVDDTEIVQGISEDRNAWHAGDGNGSGNRKSIGIEICYSKSGGTRFEKAMLNAAEFTAYLLKKYNFGIDKVKKHQDWNGKHCPHRILDDYGWDYYLNLVNGFMNGETPDIVTPVDSSSNTSKKHISVTYQIWDDVNDKWLPNVTDKSDYAGIFGHDVCAVYANLSDGNIIYEVHEQGGGWLGEVTNRSDYAGLFNKPIDAIRIKTDTEHTIHYNVHIRDGSWLGDVTGYDKNDSNNGYAGIIGKPIDAIQIWLDDIEIKESKPFGYLDWVSEDGISGWVWNQVDDEPVEVHMYVSKDGKDIYGIPGIIADVYREDLEDAGIGNGKHGFIYNHDFTDLVSGTYEIRCYGIGEKENPLLNGKGLLTIKEKEQLKIEKSKQEIKESITQITEDNSSQIIETEVEIKPESNTENTNTNNVPQEETKINIENTQNASNNLVALIAELLTKLFKLIFGKKEG